MLSCVSVSWGGAERWGGGGEGGGGGGGGGAGLGGGGGGWGYEVNSYLSQFVLKSIHSQFGQFVLKNIFFDQFVLIWPTCTHLDQFVLILVNSFSR